MATEKLLIDVQDCPCDGCQAKPCGHPARCMKFADWLNKTVDAVEVVHGWWIPHNKGQNNWCECSECNTVGSPFWKRCPVCEAKMDGRSEGE